ncbi:sushi, von Willebrand factor type A, EGF and pentraxin domain-containing protein 1-like isoform X4 [Gadus chalcogrammus]|uniref:sushi, von Willebrand factor type A, EGF and pentraxin domain-containing protein 1-like isoform X4 n=1 Tax=Gadus chalcogrammus TaxID=1042646 RepID=UPI0024C302E2|nr:sushi, von Willebrand factor type A, EGF and pentraxin domain-containing protein 1-like isoform X4 [Gadus chalcogrammus]
MQQESVRTDMVDSEQVLGCKAPMGPVLVLLLFSLLGPLGQVQAQDCEKPMRDTMILIDEDILKEHFPDGALVTFECETGYRRIGGSGKTTCEAGTWTPSTFTCEMVRCKAPFITNGSQKSGARPPYVHRSLVEYECNPGFKMEGEGVMTCQLNSTWSSTPECKVVRCKAPFIPNGSQKSGARPPYVHRSLVEYECNPGFKMEGEGVMTCQLNSTWSSTPECKAQDCEKPMRDTMTLTNEYIQKEHFPSGSLVTFKCATGYRSTGGSGKTTCEAGTWTPSTLGCEKFNCGSLKLVNGHVEYSEGTSFGSVAIFSCNDGYILEGKNLTCGNTAWLGRTPTCSVVKCESPPSVDKAEGPSPKRDFYDFASIVKYKCQKGYNITNGSASLKCSSNGKFTPNPPTCLMVRCKAPFIPNGSQKSGARPPYDYRSFVEYECNPGFKMEGEGAMTCQLNSTWSSTPECKAQDCEKPMRDTMILIDEDILKEHFPDGALVTFECETGYRRIGGSGKTTCEAGTWTPSTFTCKIVKCDSAPSVDNAEAPSPNWEFYDYASVVRYKCLKDYTINGSASLRCSNNGTFTPNPPTCLMVHCKAPFIPNGSLKSGARPPYVHRSLVEYECNPGFKMEGEGVMTCQLNSTWSSTPECKVVKCDSAPSVDNAEAPSPNWEFYDYASVVRYKCLKDYTINGSASLRCSNNGTFTPNPPTCLMVHCKAPFIPNGSLKSGARPPYVHRSLVEYECNPGFKMEGEGVMTCQLNSTWSSTPECKVVKCDSAPSVDNAEAPSPNWEFYDYASVVRYKCLKDYTINGSASLRCSNNGTFTPNPPTCLMVHCKAPFIPNGSLKSGARPPYVHRSLVEYECNPGFKMEGEGVMTCQLNSTWSSTPECKAFIMTTPRIMTPKTLRPHPKRW